VNPHGRIDLPAVQVRRAFTSRPSESALNTNFPSRLESSGRVARKGANYWSKWIAG
jgi:hypothetical protein